MLFFLNEHGDPHFLFHNFNENNISIAEKKISRNLRLLFFDKRNKYYKERYNGPTVHVKTMFYLEDKKMQGISGFFLGRTCTEK